MRVNDVLVLSMTWWVLAGQVVTRTPPFRAEERRQGTAGASPCTAPHVSIGRRGLAFFRAGENENCLQHCSVATHQVTASINRTHALLRLATTSALLAFHIAATLVQRGTSPSIAARHHRAHISARLLCWARNRQRERRRARPVRRWCRFVPVNDWRRDLRRSSVAGGRGAGSGGRLVAHVPVLPVAGTALTRHRVCSQPRYVCLYILASRRTKTKAFLHSCMLVITDTHIMFVIADTR
jgi:hypothetical protein